MGANLRPRGADRRAGNRPLSVWLDGNDLQLLENGREFFPALEAAIDAARSEIFLESYIFDPDRTGLRIAAALERAAGRGVAVRVVVDGFGGRAFVRVLLPRLRANGVKVQIYRPELRPLSLRRHRLRRLHRKLVVIDGEQAFVGGINIIDDTNGRDEGCPRHDYAVQFRGPLLAPALRVAHRLWCLLAWANLGRRLHLRLHAPARTAPAGSVRAAFVVRDNLRHRHAIEDAYLQAIHAAEEEVIIACAYFFPGHRFRQALIDAAARGVEVRLLLQGVSDHLLLRNATRALYEQLLAEGVRVFEYERSELHAKVAVVDRRWATVGSSNIDAFSLLLAREANVVVDDCAFAAQLRTKVVQACADGARELCPADWARRSRWRRLLNRTSYQLVRWAIGLAGYGDRH